MHNLFNLILDRLYTEQHEWITVDGKIGTVGASNYAQVRAYVMFSIVIFHQLIFYYQDHPSSLSPLFAVYIISRCTEIQSCINRFLQWSYVKIIIYCNCLLLRILYSSQVISKIEHAMKSKIQVQYIGFKLNFTMPKTFVLNYLRYIFSYIILKCS